MVKSYIKYLGIIMDSTLTWKQHIFCISNKISRALCVMCKLRTFLNQKMLINLYIILYFILVLFIAFKLGGMQG